MNSTIPRVDPAWDKSIPKEFKEDRQAHLKNLERAFFNGTVDVGMEKYLRRINALPFIFTLSSCRGHRERKEEGRLYFQLSVEMMFGLFVNYVIAPFRAKHPCTIFELDVDESASALFILKLTLDEWESEIRTFTVLLECFYEDIIELNQITDD